MTFKIPQSDKRISVTNRSDKSGNIWYTKNIDLSEEGYIKLSPRSVQIISDSSLDEQFDTDLNITASAGRYGASGGYFLATTDAPFKATISSISLSVTRDNDSGVPALSSESRGVWYQGAWHVSTASTVESKVIAGTWTERITGLTSGVDHPMEVFRNRNSILVGNGNVVKQYNSSYSNTTDLTVPTDYEVIGIKYSNNKVGIITTLSSTASGQDQEAFFFVWDGGTTSANGGYPVGTTAIAGIVAYKSSWVILTKTGRLLYFNGGGFEELAAFPFFFKDRIWDNTNSTGDIMLTDGDLIYIHIDGELSTEGTKGQVILSNFPGGIWCYDSAVGLYHKYSPSISQLSVITVLSGGVDTTNDLLTADSGTIPVTGSPIKFTFSPNTPIGGLTGGNVYYVINVSPTTFRLATTKENAENGVYIDLTSTGLATNYFQTLVLKDYGQTYLNTTGALTLTDTKNSIYAGLTHSFNGLNALGTSVNYFGMIVPEFDSIGYLVSPRLESSQVEDLMQKVFSKYYPLKSNDSITIKYKDEDVLGIPVATPFFGQSCTWTSNTTFTFSKDISEADSYLDDDSKELEVEIISGAGAGQMAQVSSITESSGTYTVTLTDEIEGVSASDTCNIIIDNWKKVGTITSDDTLGYKEFSIESPSKFVKLKIILKGTDVKIEEILVPNAAYRNAQ